MMIINPADRLNQVQEYYFSKKLQEIRDLNKRGFDIINLGIGSPDLMPSRETIKALVDSARDPKNHGYQPYRGIAELRDAISLWFSMTYRVDLKPDHEILPLMGSKEGITHISLAFLNPGDKVLVPELGYPAYKAVTEMVGGIAETYPMLEDNHWIPDIEYLNKKDLTGYKIMWINYPHMPTGAPPDLNVFEQLVTLASEKKILLCHDNPYSLILNESPPLSILYAEGAFEVAIELNSFSKSHNMAGWRVGWLSGKREYINAVLKVKSNFDSGMFKGIQDAAIAALDNPKDWHNQRNQIYRERRELVYELLRKLKCTWEDDQIGLFVWAKIPDDIPDVEKWVDDILYTYKVFITPGFVFGEKGKRYIRMSLCSEIEIFQEAMVRLKYYKEKA
jgi:aspartate/methionine/tyrosine aminotransferase